MQPPNLVLVLLQSDPGIARSLSTLLSEYFHPVQEATSLGELRSIVARQGARVVVLDLEIASVSEVELLARDHPGVHIVCNHRLADEEMWAAAMSVGAADCCLSGDTRSIVEAVLRHAAFAFPAAA